MWRHEDEFQPVRWAGRLAEDMASRELVGLEASNHLAPENRNEAFRDYCVEFLLGGL